MSYRRSYEMNTIDPRDDCSEQRLIAASHHRSYSPC